MAICLLSQGSCNRLHFLCLVYHYKPKAPHHLLPTDEKEGKKREREREREPIYSLSLCISTWLIPFNFLSLSLSLPQLQVTLKKMALDLISMADSSIFRKLNTQKNSFPFLWCGDVGFDYLISVNRMKMLKDNGPWSLISGALRGNDVFWCCRLPPLSISIQFYTTTTMIWIIQPEDQKKCWEKELSLFCSHFGISGNEKEEDGGKRVQRPVTLTDDPIGEVAHDLTLAGVHQLLLQLCLFFFFFFFPFFFEHFGMLYYLCVTTKPATIFGLGGGLWVPLCFSLCCVCACLPHGTRLPPPSSSLSPNDWHALMFLQMRFLPPILMLLLSLPLQALYSLIHNVNVFFFCRIVRDALFWCFVVVRVYPHIISSFCRPLFGRRKITKGRRRRRRLECGAPSYRSQVVQSGRGSMCASGAVKSCRSAHSRETALPYVTYQTIRRHVSIKVRRIGPIALLSLSHLPQRPSKAIRPDQEPPSRKRAEGTPKPNQTKKEKKEKREKVF